MPSEHKQWISSDIKKLFQNIDGLKHQVQNPSLVFFASHWRVWGGKHLKDTYKHGAPFKFPELMRVMQTGWLVCRSKKIPVSYISKWTVSFKVRWEMMRWFCSFSMVSYFPLPECVTSLRLGSVFCVKQKSSHHLALLVFWLPLLKNI